VATSFVAPVANVVNIVGAAVDIVVAILVVHLDAGVIAMTSTADARPSTTVITAAVFECLVILLSRK